MKQKNARFLLFINCLLLATAAAAQRKLEVTVTDAATTLPISRATVTISKLTATTDDKGTAVFSNLAPGSYSITCSSVGYLPYKETMILSGSVTAVAIKLTPRTGELANVTVVGLPEEQAAAKKIKEGVMPVTILTAKQIENRAAALNELLARQTGVQIRRTGGLGSESRISVRGLEGKRVQIYIDGNPLNTPDGSLGINDLPLQIIERIEIYKGTIPAWLGGDGLGSAVNVVLRHRDVSYIDATAGYQSYNTLNTGLILKKTFEKPGIEAGIGAFTNSSDNNYVMESPYQPGLKIRRDHDRFRSLLAGGAVKFHKLWFDEVALEGAYIGIQKQLQGIQQNIQHIESRGHTGVAALNLTKQYFLSPKLAFKYHAVLADMNIKFIDTSSYSYGWDGSRRPSIYGRGELGNGPNLTTTKQKEWRQQLNLNYTISNRFTLNLNNTMRRGKTDPSDEVANTFAGKNLFNYPGSLFNTITGLTLESHFANDRLLLSAAAKHYYNKVNGYNTNIYTTGEPEYVNNTQHTPGYNIGLRYHFTPALFIKASHERAIRMPNNAELFGDGILITPAVFLKPEKAFNTSMGMVYDKTDEKDRRLQVDVNGFYMSVNNLIQLSGNGLSIGYVNFTRAHIMGADAEIKYDLTNHLFASVNATYQRLTDANRSIPGTDHVANPTYKLALPNVPQFFGNWGLEYSRATLLGKGSNTKLLYDGSYTRQYNYGFELSVYDHFMIPSFITHTLSLEQS